MNAGSTSPLRAIPPEVGANTAAPRKKDPDVRRFEAVYGEAGPVDLGSLKGTNDFLEAVASLDESHPVRVQHSFEVAIVQPTGRRDWMDHEWHDVPTRRVLGALLAANRIKGYGPGDTVEFEVIPRFRGRATKHVRLRVKALVPEGGEIVSASPDSEQKLLREMLFRFLPGSGGGEPQIPVQDDTTRKIVREMHAHMERLDKRLDEALDRIDELEENRVVNAQVVQKDDEGNVIVDTLVGLGKELLIKDVKKTTE